MHVIRAIDRVATELDRENGDEVGIFAKQHLRLEVIDRARTSGQDVGYSISDAVLQ
jgi:hypothetical protein